MLLLFFFWLLGIADLVLTAILLHSNTMEESNPLLLWFLHRGGLIAMISFKVSFHTFMICLIALLIKRGWIKEKIASRYILVGICAYAVIVVPAYLLIFFAP